MQKFIQILFPVNVDTEENLIKEINYKLEELKQIAYSNNNNDLVEVINSVSLSAIEWREYREETYFTQK